MDETVEETPQGAPNVADVAGRDKVRDREYEELVGDFDQLANILNRISESESAKQHLTHLYQPGEDEHPPMTTTYDPGDTVGRARAIEKVATARGMLMVWYGRNWDPDPEGHSSMNDRVVELLTDALKELVP